MAAAGSLLRDARQRAGLSQVELARRAGVTQSVVSAYESGARQPSMPTLERLIAAAGFELDLGLRPQDSTSSRAPTARSRLARQRRRVKEIAERYGLTNVRVFGSVARGDDRAGSDIDLLVDVPPGVGLLDLGRCQAELEALLDARVDLVPADGLKPAVASEVLAQARAL